MARKVHGVDTFAPEAVTAEMAFGSPGSAVITLGSRTPASPNLALDYWSGCSSHRGNCGRCHISRLQGHSWGGSADGRPAGYRTGATGTGGPAATCPGRLDPRTRLVTTPRLQTIAATRKASWIASAWASRCAAAAGTPTPTAER